MDEYIKREDAIKHLRGACIAKYPLSFAHGIFASADEISKLPTADVAPKSESEMRGASFYFELEKCEERGKQLMREHDAEVAREIFDEIEALRLKHTYGEIDEADLNIGLYELKKKYTEGKT